ncbi:MAG: PSD1 and planctomycete cytochrome C domain-containing protein [Phycisphaerales bacterium JB039]
MGLPANRTTAALCAAAALLGLVGAVGAVAVGGVGDGGVVVAAKAGPVDQTPSFGRDVRPILVRSCLKCHGFDPSTREADLRLDHFDGATAARPGGGAAIVPGDPEASLLLERVTADPADRMPPEGEPLSSEEIDLLRRWIAAGAPYDRHWSLEPVRRPALPQVQDAEWAQRPIDAFVRARQEAAGLTPAPEADRRTLLRRLSFDLIGLPPAPEEVEAFVEDTTPGAWERQVDRLLASPHFGERWGRHWLDLMRYAETYAHEYDYPIRHAYQYRDYVIRAFNEDVPYDQFVTEHIAGDLLPEPRRHPTEGYNESILGTMFWWLSQGTHSPVDLIADEAERIDNQIDVLSKAFLATTVSCARCHDHKFDPIPTKEYYGLAGFIQSSRRIEAYLDPGGRIEAAAGELEQLQDRIAAALNEQLMTALAPVAAEAPTYLPAALDVLFTEPAAGEPAPETTGEVFETFDSAGFEGWTVEGEAFTDAPSRASDNDLTGAGGTAVGAGFANSHIRLGDDGSVEADRRTGRLLSREFIIERRYLHFKIGGGDHPGQTGLRVLIDGKPVRETTGHNGLHLRQERLDLTDLRGQRARIEIIDQATGGWGNTRVDHIVFSDEPRIDRPRRRNIALLADGRGLDAAALEKWVSAIQSVEAGHPLDLAQEIAGSAQPESILSEAQDRRARWRAWMDASESFADFSQPGAADGWTFDGWAFGASPEDIADPGAWLGAGETVRIATEGVLSSARLSPRLTGAVRSGNFDIHKPFLHVRARGRGSVRVIMEGYTMDEYNPLLYENILHHVESDDWQWYSHRLDRYVGHRGFYEIVEDSLDATLEIAEIRWSDSSERPPMRPRALEPLLMAGAADPAALAQICADALARAAEGETDTLALSLAAWAIEQGLAPIDTPEINALRSQAQDIAASIPAPMRALVMEDVGAEEQPVFIRGNHRTPGEMAARTFLGVLCDGSPLIQDPDGSGRLDLAEKLLDESNPLPARVIVNRIWGHLMGRGIVETPDDFGLLGRSPTHPELLDYLADRFRHELDWSIKALIREIVLTNTYRMQSGALDARAQQVDPNNHLLSIREPRRLEGEPLRDAVLAISGRLDPAMYGPSVPVHLTRFMTGRGRPGASGPLDGAGRRSVYQEVRRNFPIPMMSTFDAPVPHSTMGRRLESNVPAQSLILMNDPFITQQAGLLAERLFKEAHESPEARIDRLYQLALGRQPTANEMTVALGFLRAQAAEYAASGSGGADARWEGNRPAWTDFCHIIFNLKEFTYIE